jgi:hypothetical protein
MKRHRKGSVFLIHEKFLGTHIFLPVAFHKRTLVPYYPQSLQLNHNRAGLSIAVINKNWIAR